MLLLRVHHIITDGLSMSMVYAQIKEYYETYTKGDEPSNPKVSGGYGGYIDWLQGEFKQHIAPERKAFWEQRLVGGDPGI